MRFLGGMITRVDVGYILDVPEPLAISVFKNEVTTYHFY